MFHGPYWSAKTPKDLIQRLAWDAFLWRGLDSIKHPPGRMIQRLSDSERELLKNLTAKDMQDARFPYR